MKILISFLLVLFSLSSSFSKIHKEWEARYDKSVNLYQEFRDFKIDYAGNIIIAAYNNNVLSMKYSNSGELLWTYEYIDLISGARVVTVDKNGNVYIAGDGNFGLKYLTIKLNSDGVQQWVSEYVNGGWAIPHGIALDSLGNVYVTGSDISSLIATVKYNPEGSLIWERIFRGNLNGNIQQNSLFADPTGNVYITGTNYNGLQKFDYIFVKYDSSGNLLDTQYADGNYSYDVAISSCTDQLFNIYITGNSDSNYYTTKWDSSGQLIWARGFSGNGYYNNARSVCTDIFNNVYVTGSSRDSAFSDLNIVTLKYNLFGGLVWVKNFSGPGDADDVPNSIAADTAGNVYITGYITNEMNDRDYVTFKYDSAGTLLWSFINSGISGGSDVSYQVKTDMNGNVFVSGFSKGQFTDGDVVTIKYSEFSGIKQNENSIPASFRLYQNYPNPFNPMTKIRFSLPNPSKGGAQGVKLIIYDILGREVTTLVNEQLKPGTYEVTWDGSGFASGIYFYKMEAVETTRWVVHTDSKKMVLIK